MRGEPAAAEANVTLHQPEAHRVFSWGSCPWITGAWQWRAAQAPSHWCRSRPYSFVSVFPFFFCPTQVCREFLAFWEV